MPNIDVNGQNLLSGQAHTYTGPIALPGPLLQTNVLGVRAGASLFSS